LTRQDNNLTKASNSTTIPKNIVIPEMRSIVRDLLAKP
jgi:hypothetical protein